MLYQSSLLNEIQVIINNPDTKLEDVLLIDIIPKAVLTKNPSIIKYLKQNSKVLLKYALSDEKSKISMISYSILLACNPDILGSIFEDDYYRDMVSSLLADPTTSDVIIGRIASITLSCFTAIPNQAFESYGFIYHLLHHCDNSAVFNLFQTICCEDPRFTSTQEWLDQMGFSEYLLRELLSIDYDHTPTDPNFIKDKTFVNLFCFYKLASICCSNPILRSSFETEPFVRVLARDSSFSNTHLMSSKWKTVNALTSPITSNNMLTYHYDKAISIVTEPFDVLREYRVCALEFITKMMRFCPQTISTVKEKSILQNVISIILNFRDSTILHDTVLGFVGAGLELDKELSKQITQTLTPLMIDFADDRSDRVFSSFCFRVVEEMIKRAKKDKALAAELHDLPEFEVFVKSMLEPRRKAIETPYGCEPGAKKLLSTLKNIFE